MYNEKQGIRSNAFCFLLGPLCRAISWIGCLLTSRWEWDCLCCLPNLVSSRAKLREGTMPWPDRCVFQTCLSMAKPFITVGRLLPWCPNVWTMYWGPHFPLSILPGGLSSCLSSRSCWSAECRFAAVVSRSHSQYFLHSSGQGRELQETGEGQKCFRIFKFSQGLQLHRGGQVVLLLSWSLCAVLRTC